MQINNGHMTSHKILDTFEFITNVMFVMIQMLIRWIFSKHENPVILEYFIIATNAVSLKVHI